MKIYKPQVAIVSDIHAGVHQNNSTWHTILLDWANWFKEECIKHDIQDIIIPGDLFHERNEVNVNTLHVISKILESWKQFNLIILIGNHDSYYKDRSDVHSLEMLKHWSNITIVDTIHTDVFFGKTITFCPWASNVNNIPKSDILFGHFEIQGFNVTKEQVCENGESIFNLLDIAKLVISGHFHIRSEQKFDKGTILYTGCAYELYWGDYNTPKGYHILDISNLSYEFFQNTVSPRHIKLFSSDIKKHGITSEIKSNLQNNLIKIIIDENVNTEALTKLIEKLKIYKPLDIKIDYIIDNNQTPEDFHIEGAGVDITKNIHEYIENIDIPHKSLVEKYILELYRKVA